MRGAEAEFSDAWTWQCLVHPKVCVFCSQMFAEVRTSRADA